MADEHLLSTRQQQLVLAVVEALNDGAVDLHARVRAAVTPRPEPTDIDAVQRIVALDWVGYTSVRSLPSSSRGCWTASKRSPMFQSRGDSLER